VLYYNVLATMLPFLTGQGGLQFIKLIAILNTILAHIQNIIYCIHSHNVTTGTGSNSNDG